MTVSPRVSLARLAHDVALSDPGVAAMDAGPAGIRRTHDLPGVISAARPGGGYELELHLVALPQDLQATGRRIRTAVAQAAGRAGLAGQLASVSVRIEDVVAP